MNPFSRSSKRRAEAIRVRRSQQIGDEIDERFDEAIALWQIEHNAVTMDMTPEQRRRWLEFIRAADNGIWSPDLVFVRRLVERRSLTP